MYDIIVTLKSSFIDEPTYNTYFSALIDGKRYLCHEIVTKLLAQNIDIKSLYIDLFQTSLYEIGSLWECNVISVSTEHIATAITESLMSLTYPTVFSKERKHKTVIISCMFNEYHQIGARMVADIFELNGWDSFFVGANAPLQDLMKLIEEKNLMYWVCL